MACVLFSGQVVSLFCAFAAWFIMRLRAGEKGALQRVDNAEDPIRRDLALARASRLRRKSILRAAGSMFSMAAESMVSLDAGSMVSMDASVGFLEED
ncbi:hypothetical protein T484DRAFT_1913057, partial [Baffinella frigidus]